MYKTTIVIWRQINPEIELSALAREAEEGDAYCSRMSTVHVEDPTKDPDWDGTEFFGEDLAESSKAKAGD